MESIIVAIIGSGALSTCISAIFNWAGNKSKARGGVMAGTRIILYDRIKFLGRKYIADKQITSEDLEDLIEMHTVYHTDLGGNGYLDTIMAAVKNLPIVDPQKK